MLSAAFRLRRSKNLSVQGQKTLNQLDQITIWESASPAAPASRCLAVLPNPAPAILSKR
jgi:hypothetical protein